ncbi:helix-turn-helix domain-containing protein [Sphingobacterium suaedae]|uniref:Helix-turn-helix domain-containing protein n=1 Tax=Sphingobacterium suaedae TaxID=1686402 RepID=A0ABW5KFX3_9SPHI
MAEQKDETLVMIGQRFKKFRKDNKISQEDIDVVTPVVISRIENGHRMPNVEVLIFIANKYGADINWILTGETVKKTASASSELIARVTLLETRVRMLEKESGKELFK